MVKSKAPQQDNQITFYRSIDGAMNIEVLYAGENVWITQKRMADLFEVDRTVVTKHLKNIFDANELEKISVCAKVAHTTGLECYKIINQENYAPNKENIALSKSRIWLSVK